MNVILFTKCHQRPVSIRLDRPHCYMALVAGFLAVSAALFAGGYWLGTSQERQLEGRQLVARWERELEAQRQALERSRSQAEARLAQLGQRVGTLQAHLIRLDALGDRLTRMARLDDGEFDFAQPPALGGPEQPAAGEAVAVEDLLRQLRGLEARVRDRQQQLVALESLLLRARLDDEVLPEGRPVRKGWLSSYYGKRTDPFDGKPEFHRGVDFAGKLGSEVVAVAAGVVVFSGKRYGYGNMVEIDHGNGYVTRYGHNQENLVSVGDRVEKGQPIAHMGSSGRSTGPHVHFEVLRNGRKVDPAKYIARAP